MYNLKIIKFGIIGAGEIVKRRHIPELSVNKNIELVAIAGFSEERASELAETYSIPKVFYGADGWKKLLDLDIDAVCIATPTQYHSEMIMESLKRNIHVFIEKPMTINIEDAAKIVSEAAKSNLVIGVGHQRRGMPLYQECKKLIKNKEIGKVQSFRFFLGHNMFRLWNSAGWLTEENKSGGVLFDMGIHAADLILWLSGQQPKNVRARLFKKGLSSAYESACCIFDLGKTQYASFEVSWIVEPPTKYMYVFGENGSMYIDEVANTWGKLVIRKQDGDKVWMPPIPKMNSAGYPDWGVIESFIQAILNPQVKPLCTAKEQFDTISLIDACRKDAMTG